jgi:acyl carrier protein
MNLGHSPRKGRLKSLLRGVSDRLSSKSEDDREPLKPNADEIQLWLITKLAMRLGVGPEEMHIDRPLADYGLDSRTALSLSGELEEWLGRELSPTLLWDYPTIEALSAHLAGDPDPMPSREPGTDGGA